MTTYDTNVNSADYRLSHKPVIDVERHIASLERSIQTLKDAGLPTEYYENALAALKEAKR